MAPITIDTPPRRTSAPRSRKPTSTSASRTDLSEAHQPRDSDNPELYGVLETSTTTNSNAVNANNTGGANTPRRNGTRTPTKPSTLSSTSNLLTSQSPHPPPAQRSSKPSRTSTLSPQKKRRYIPGGPGGGGRYVDEDGNEEPVGGTGPGGYNYAGPRGVVGRENARRGIGFSPGTAGSPSSAARSPQKYIRPERRDRARERTTERTRTVPQRNARVQLNLRRELGGLGQPGFEGERSQMSFSGTAMASMAAKVDGGYKPREERGWEEFHPELDVEVGMPVFSAQEVDGVPEVQKDQSMSATPELGKGSREGSVNVLRRSVTPAGEVNGLQRQDSVPGTPGSRRRPGRPPRDPVAWASRVGKVNGTPAPAPAPAPRIAPLQNQNAKERLTLPQPSFRKVNTFEKFEGMGHRVDRSMANVGYQDTDIWTRPESLIKMSDSYLSDDLDVPVRSSENHNGNTAGSIGRVEYDMDEQDDHWLQMYNLEYRRAAGIEDISHEMFEMTITKIEKEWHALEKRIPKPNPKPPQTQRPRSSSAAAVNGEPQPGEEQDSKCAICDDGDCENTNAIVFCDGCDLAVHQECYGVPFIPEGQWLCRKCQLIGRGIPTCIFCPNTDGGFKQTNSSRWAHLLCAMWIPEVSLGNHIFMEPVMDVEKVPKPRWKLSCYICQQQMGACIQCGNKACYQAFHVTCARRARLFLKMKNATGTLIELDGGTHLKAFCDKHCPTEYSKENDVARATREARTFYKQTMKGRIWADSQAAALAIAASYPEAAPDHASIEPRPKHRLSFSLGSNKRKKEEPPQKDMWKLPSGAPVIPAYVFDIVSASLQRFTIRKHKEWVAAACKYWTLKRESRRGAALLKRLQLPMEPFSSMEITRRNFAAMGEAGRLKLEKRREFVALLVKDMERLREISDLALERETLKLEEARLEKEVFDLTYFPVARLLPAIIEKVMSIDKTHIFSSNLHQLLHLANDRYYARATVFATDLAAVFREGLTSVKDTLPDEPDEIFSSTADYNIALKDATQEIKERKKVAKKIIKAIQPALSEAIRAEGDVCKMPAEEVTAKLADMDFALEAAVAATPEEILGPPRKEASTSADELASEAPRILPPTSSYAPILPPGSAAKDAPQPVPNNKEGEEQVEAVAQDVEMELGDEDAEGEEIDEDDIFTPIPSTTREASVKAEPVKEVGGVSAAIESMPPPSARASKAPTPSASTAADAPGQGTEADKGDTINISATSPAPGDFLTKGGLPWYLEDAQYDPATESFPKERTPTPTPEPEPQPDTSPLSSPAPEPPELTLPLEMSPVKEPVLPAQGSPAKGGLMVMDGDRDGGDEVMGGVELTSEAETVRLPDHPAAGAAVQDEMLLGETEEQTLSTERGGLLEVERDGHLASSSGGELSDMDDEELDGLGAGMEIGDGVVGIRRGNRKRRKVLKALL